MLKCVICTVMIREEVLKRKVSEIQRKRSTGHFQKPVMRDGFRHNIWSTRMGKDWVLLCQDLKENSRSLDLKHHWVLYHIQNRGMDVPTKSPKKYFSLTFPFSWLWRYIRIIRGILTSVMMKDPFATVPRW